MSDRVKDCLIAPLDLLITMDIGRINDLIELREMLEVSMIAAAVERPRMKILRTWNGFYGKCRIRTCRQMNPGTGYPVALCVCRGNRQYHY